jgi:hypothetical protein
LGKPLFVYGDRVLRDVELRGKERVVTKIPVMSTTPFTPRPEKATDDVKRNESLTFPFPFR